MANQVGEINVKIGADTSDLNQGVDESQAKIKTFGDASKVAGDKVTAGFKSMGKAALQFAAAYATIASTFKSVKLADEFNLLETRVRTATKSTGDFNEVFSSLTNNAMASGASLEATVSAFQSISAAGRDLGKTNQEAIQFVDTFQKLGAIGGASTEAMKNSLTQMSQSMAGGVVRAEEFNSIIENTPEVARAMADALGKSVGELRMLVLEGQLMADDVFDAILSKAEEVNNTFGEMPKTLGRSSESAVTAFGLMFSAIDESYQVTQFLSETLDKISGQATEITSRLSDDAMTQKAWELVDTQERLNTLLAARGRNYNPLLISQERKKLELIQQQMSGVAAANRVTAEMDKRAADSTAKKEAAEQKAIKLIEDKQWKENAVLDVQLDQAVLAEKNIETENKNYKAEQKRNAERAKAAAEEAATRQKKLEDIQAEYAWQEQLAQFNGEATGEEQQDKDQAKTQAKLEALQESYLSEQELLRLKYEEEQFIIDEAYMNQQMTAEEHEQAMTDIASRAADARKKLADAEEKARIGIAKGMMSNLSTLMNSGSKEMFEIGKTAATANALISGYEAAVHSYNAGAKIGGPVVGAAFAATSVLATGAQIQQIQSQQFGSSATGGATTYSAGVPAVNTQESAPAGGTLTVEGLSAASLFTGDSVAAIAEELLEYQRQGGNVVLQG